MFVSLTYFEELNVSCASGRHSIKGQLQALVLVLFASTNYDIRNKRGFSPQALATEGKFDRLVQLLTYLTHCQVGLLVFSAR